MPQDLLMEWEARYRLEATADGYARLDTFLEGLEGAGVPVSNTASRLVDGTVLVMRACWAYWDLDGRTSGARRFLQAQRYPDGVSDLTGYVLTFDLYGTALAKVAIPEGPILADIDLADLYAHPWHPYRLVGYNRLYITHADWSEITASELRELESQVLQDIRYDFTDEEVDLWFETSRDATSLTVSLQDLDD